MILDLSYGFTVRSLFGSLSIVILRGRTNFESCKNKKKKGTTFFPLTLLSFPLKD